jgi:hypothetical protein
VLGPAHQPHRPPPPSHPNTIRHRLLHIAARTSPRRLRLDTTWPWTPDLLDAIDCLKTRLQPPPLTVPIRPAIHPGL